MLTFKQVKLLVIGGLALALAAVAATAPVGNLAGTSGAPSQVEAVYITDFGDDRRLVGAVDNVFVGQVVAQAGTTVFAEVPETQFQVEVLENIKGSLGGKVIVNQEGGLDGDQLVLVAGDSFLKPGQTCLFATRVYKDKGWNTLVPRYGDLLIADAQQRASLVERFKKATQHQIPYTPV